ncbi:MAG TPA: hypothetical protein VFM14_12945 [Gemmatimonadales bacterium]|nr:hypothetical protein [Gemmatimonadales bacterium]
MPKTIPCSPFAACTARRRCPGLALLALAACAPQRPLEPAPRPPETTGDPTRRYPLDQVFLLEMAGVPPDDTTLTVARGARRVIVLRHGPPDNLVFADLTLPPDAFDTAAAADSIRLSVRPRPGVYGVDLDSGAPIRGASVTFEYPVHFAAPAEARQRYGSDAAFEAVLAVGELLPDGGIRFLISTRPTADNLSAVLPGPGSYVVGAPR